MYATSDAACQIPAAREVDEASLTGDGQARPEGDPVFWWQGIISCYLWPSFMADWDPENRIR
ncbi:MAG: hypothetical protein R6T89_01710 [Candidatus Syntrophosphaera sp.]